MIIDSKNGTSGVLINATTNTRIPFACWADLERGEYIAFATTPDGSQRLLPLRKYRGKATRLSFVESYAPPLRTPSVVDAKAALEEVVEYRRTVNQRLLVPGEECDYPGCHKLAGWHVAHEKMLQPVKLADGRVQEHGVIIRVCNFCDRHWRAPVSISERGVESEVAVALARPDAR